MIQKTNMPLETLHFLIFEYENNVFQKKLVPVLCFFNEWSLNSPPSKEPLDGSSDSDKHDIKSARTQKFGRTYLVGGWTNPVEKYARLNRNLPQVSGWKFQKNIWNHHPFMI